MAALTPEALPADCWESRRPQTHALPAPQIVAIPHLTWPRAPGGPGRNFDPPARAGLATRAGGRPGRNFDPPARMGRSYAVADHVRRPTDEDGGRRSAVGGRSANGPRSVGGRSANGRRSAGGRRAVGGRSADGRRAVGGRSADGRRSDPARARAPGGGRARQVRWGIL